MKSRRRADRRTPAVCAAIAVVALVMPAACTREKPEPVPLSTVPAPAPAASASASYTLRPFALRSPRRSIAAPAPLVVLLHGFGGNGAGLDAAWRFREAAADRGVLLAVPDGTLDGDGNRFWNASVACCDFEGRGVDDVAYLDAIIDDASRRAPVDPKRIHLVGFSNGGFLAHRYACARAFRVASIVSVAGAGPNPSAGDPACAPSAPVSVLEIHGDADPMVAYGGGSVGGGLPRRAPYPSVTASLAPWRTRNACASTVAGDSLDLDVGLPGNETAVERASCAEGSVVELWTVHGGGHALRFAPDWATRILAFVEAHPKP